MDRNADNDSRRVVVFIALGLVTALAVGVAVWRVSAPSSVVAGHVEPVVQSSSTATQSSAPSNEYSTTSAAPEPQNEEQAAPVATNDPYLAPNAVLNRTQAAGPTAVYRPDNVSAWTQGNGTAASPQGSVNAAPSSAVAEQSAPSTENVPVLPNEGGMDQDSSSHSRPERPDREDNEPTHEQTPPNTPQTQTSTPDSPETPVPSTEQPTGSPTEEPSPSSGTAAGSEVTLTPNTDEPTVMESAATEPTPLD
ncbi:hypothetical protein [Corynebacterium sp.]|uniref:hypothetical protein n=1 Tax=Corynebacterium sp. TaxID=1720 RepID=UPI0026DDBECE|nr:hypothetical protein [Corynebacterium sp.]MDO5032111.1 hypothetical protein [Corynebacterium sp.]